MKRIAEESHHIREKNRIMAKTIMKWENLPKKILIVHKETDLDFICAKIEELIQWLLFRWTRDSQEIELIGIYPSILQNKTNIFPGTLEFYDESAQIPQFIDLIITLGGDGTVLLAAWLFQDHVPPIVPFHFGTLGFLTLFNWENFSQRLDSIFSNGCRFNSRMRLTCQVHKFKNNTPTTFNVLNEIVIERGASPFMAILDIFGDEDILTRIQADGVAIATPTGSTAYSVINLILIDSIIFLALSWWFGSSS